MEADKAFYLVNCLVKKSSRTVNSFLLKSLSIYSLSNLHVIRFCMLLISVILGLTSPDVVIWLR